MKSGEKDSKLREMMKEIRLESPGPEFTSRVMGAIMKETEKKPSVNALPLLGKRFWMLLAAFAGLALVFMLLGTPEQGTGLLQGYFSRIPAPDLSPLRETVTAAFSRTGSVTWTVMLVLLGGSGLILADKLFEKKKSVSLA